MVACPNIVTGRPYSITSATCFVRSASWVFVVFWVFLGGWLVRGCCTNVAIEATGAALVLGSGLEVAFIGFVRRLCGFWSGCWGWAGGCGLLGSWWVCDLAGSSGSPTRLHVHGSAVGKYTNLLPGFHLSYNLHISSYFLQVSSYAACPCLLQLEQWKKTGWLHNIRLCGGAGRTSHRCCVFVCMFLPHGLS